MINPYIINLRVIHILLFACMLIIYHFFCSNLLVIRKTKNMFYSHFDMKGLGKVNCILDMKITRTYDGIFLDNNIM